MITLTGCGGRPAGVPTATVTGKVTLDGTPLEKGSITFIPVDGIGAPSGGNIVKGLYTAEVQLGQKRVEIRSTKVTGQRDAYPGDPKSPKLDIFEELIPLKYNAQSELKSTVNKGANTADFPLELPKN